MILFNFFTIDLQRSPSLNCSIIQLKVRTNYYHWLFGIEAFDSTDAQTNERENVLSHSIFYFRCQSSYTFDQIYLIFNIFNGKADKVSL